MLKLLLQVLRGEFELLTVKELCQASANTYVQDGLCAVVRDPSATGAAAKPALAADTELLQVAHSDSQSPCKAGVRQVCGGDASVCYLLCSDVRDILQLTGARSHLWEVRPSRESQPKTRVMYCSPRRRLCPSRSYSL